MLKNETKSCLVVNWPAVAGATGYTLYWAPVQYQWYSVNQTSAFKVSVAGTSYTQVNMPDGYYSYLVTYTKGGAESAASSPVSVTVRAIIQSPLIITGSNPDNNATGVISTNPIWINVYPAIDPTSCSPANFSLIDSLNNIVPVRISNCYPDSTFVIVTPVSPLEKSESYSLVITGLKSQAGLVMISPHTLSFTTGTYIPQSFTPSGVSVSVGAGEATLMWSPANNAVKYNIYWSTTSDLTTSNGAKASIAIPPFVHTGLSTGTGYFYIVTSENSDAIESSASSVVAVTAK